MPRFSYDDQVTTDQPGPSWAAALRAAMQALGAAVEAVGGYSRPCRWGSES